MRKLLTLSFCLLFIEFSCTNDVFLQSEIINPPVNLSITAKTTPFNHYSVQFSAYNDETNFAGYGVFVGSSSTAAESLAVQEKSSAGLFCPNAAILSSVYIIQVGGGSELSNMNCYSSSTTLNAMSISSGTYISIRARIERSTNPWSSAATAKVP